MIFVLLVLVLVFLPLGASQARDLDGQFADSPLKSWFDGLRSGRGPCCSFADGIRVPADDYGTERVAEGSTENRYWVSFSIAGKFIEHMPVPADALITEPNLAGRAMVWPYVDTTGAVQIRCFIPGAGL